MKQITRAMAEAEGIQVFSEDDILSMYDDSLDEMGDFNLGSLSYAASYVLKNVDPTAYRCGFCDYTACTWVPLEDDGWICYAGYLDLVDKLDVSDED